jgi:penicillin-binding protein 2
VGKRGLEKAYDEVLRGERGYRLSLVDALGREIHHFGEGRDLAPKPGRNIRLTLDIELQYWAEQLLQGKQGAIVAMELKEGGILAMASAPDFPLSPFARHLAPEVWQALQNNEGHPLLNRVTQAQLPPGSIYKPVSSLAAFKQELIQLSDSMVCQGGVKIGRRTFPCWKPEGHGAVAFHQAIAQSCNSYFYMLSKSLPFDVWSHWGGQLGMGQATGIDLPDELAGLLPDRAYMDKKYGQRGWSLGQMANLMIGQGDLLVTPLQMLRLAGTLALKGMQQTPHLVASIETKEGQWQNLAWKHQKLSLQTEAMEAIHHGMALAANAPKGTALAASVKGWTVCGKTGSAQNPHGESHAWFIGFAPAESPEIALVVIVEQGGSGGQAAAPLAGQFFKKYRGHD